MKKTVKGVMAALMLTMAVSGAAYASDGAEVEAGAKIWFNTVKMEDSTSSATSDMAVMAGPAVSAKFSNNVFLDASIMTTAAKYKVSDLGNAEFSRTDFDLAVGYCFTPHVGAYAGFRNIAFSGDVKSTTSGPLLGVRGSAPINDSLSIYGDLQFLLFTEKPDSGPSENAPGFGIELGVKYAFTTNIDGGVGLKMEQTEGADSKHKGTFSGPIVSAMYKF